MFIELLIGAMLTPSGFVTDAYLILNMRDHWCGDYKWLQRGNGLGWRRPDSSPAWPCPYTRVKRFHLVIDDTLTLRASKKASGSQIHHRHGNKPNLAQYVRGQCWVN